MLFAVMTLVLVLRPYGLLGAAGPRMNAVMMLKQRPC
jgi:hypothetical protein